MLILPAIDLLDGKAVRLFQGDYSKCEVYGDPVEFALEFQKLGATHLHIVDLNGAREGKPVNKTIIENICRKTDLFVELGGGIRSDEIVAEYLASSVDRVILGTAAFRDPAFLQRMTAQYGEKIAVGVDAREGKVSVEGWLETSNTDSYNFCKKMKLYNIKYVIYTDISRDGAQGGPNLDAYEKLHQIEGLNVIASGGVSSIQDLVHLNDIGVYGAIVGKAIYTGAVSLKEALRIQQ